MVLWVALTIFALHMSVAFAGARVQREKRHAKGTMTATGELGRDINSSAGCVQYRLPCFGVDWHMHGPRTARRTLRPFVLALGALALGALALGCYMVADHHSTCDAGAAIPFVAGGACVAAAVTLGFLASYRRRCRKPGPLGWIAIVVVSLWVTTVTEVFALLASLPAFWC